MLRRWFEWIGFVYGTFATVLALALYIMALGGEAVLSEDRQWALILLTMSFLFFFAHTRDVRPNPRPLFRLSRGLVRFARLLLVGGYGLLLMHIGLIAMFREAGEEDLLLLLSLALAALFLATSATIAVSYGICLNNVFSEAFLVWRTPMTAIRRLLSKRRASSRDRRDQ